MRRLALLCVLLPIATAPAPLGGLPPAQLDIAYGTYDPSLLLDWYPPADVKGPHGAVVFLHGGSAPFGTKQQIVNDEAEMLELLRLNGIGVAAVEFRPYPQFVYPAQLDDVRLAMQYLRLNAATFGFDPARLGAWGNSSGALISGWLAWGGEGAVPGGTPLQQQSTRPAALIDSGAIADFTLLVPWFPGDFFGQTYLGQVDTALLNQTSLTWQLCNVPRAFTPPVFTLYGVTLNEPPLVDPHDAWFAKVLRESLRGCEPEAAALSQFEIRDEPLTQLVGKQVVWLKKRLGLPGPVVWPPKY